MAANKIYLQVDFQSEGANAAIDKLNANIKNIGTTSTKSTKESAAGFNSLSVSISQTTRGLDQMMGLLAGLGISRIGIAMVQAADDITKTTAALTAMGATANEAANAIESIRVVAKTQPFSFDDLREMAQRLRGFGFDLRQIPVLIENISNAAAALGKGKIAVDSITLALGQMRAKGIIQGQEAFRQLAEQGINSIKYLQKAIQEETGKAVSEMDVRKMIEKQMIGAEKGVQVILDGMEKEFGGAGKKMADAMGTVQFDKLIDDLKKLGGAIAADFMPAIIKFIGQLREMAYWFSTLPKPIQDTALALGALTLAFTALGAVSKLGLLSWIPTALGMVGQLTKALGSLGLAFQVLFTESALAGAFTSRLVMIGTMVPAVVNLGIAVTAVGAAFLTWKAGEWLREKIDPDSWLGHLIGRSEEAKDKNFVKQARADLEQLAATYQKWMKEAKLPEADNMSLIPFNKQTEVELKDSLQKMRMLLDADAVARKARAAKLIIENKEEAKHQEQIADQILARAQARVHGALFGINDKYAGELKELGVTAKNLAKVLEPSGDFDMMAPKALDQLAGKALLVGKVYTAMADDVALAVKKIAEENAKLIEEKEGERLAGQKVVGDWLHEWASGYVAAYKLHLQYVEESNKIERETMASQLEFEKTLLEADRDEKLAAADVVHRQTLGQEIAYQKQVFAIKQEYAERIRDIERDLLDQKYREEMDLVEALHDAKVMTDADYYVRSAVLHAANEERKKQVTVKADVDIGKDRLAASKATNDAIYNEQKKIYDKLKSSLDRVFDALLDKSTSIWQSIANGLKTAIIGAIKEIVTSRAAAALMQLFGYGTVSFGGGPRGLGGQQPTFGGGAGGTVAAAAGGLGFLGRLFSPRAAMAQAGVSPAQIAANVPSDDAGPLEAATAAASPVATPAFGAVSMLKGMAPLAALLGGGLAAINGIQRGGRVGLGQALGGGAAAGIGAAHLAAGLGMTTAGGTLGLSAAGGGLLGAGAALAGYGLYRGGKSGIALTAGGGAMMGAVIGTAFFPGIGTLLGAGIGAAVGGIAGLFRSFVKTADQKLQEKLKLVYSIDVTDKGVRAQILEIAKQKYGGNLDMAVRSKEVMDLVQLYSMATGKQAGGMARPMYGATLAQSGSGLTLQPVYSGGQLVTSPYSGTTTSQYAQGIYVQLNPQQANDLFEGKVVNVINTNPDAVGTAAASSSRSGSSRDAQRSALMEPLTVVR